MKHSPREDEDLKRNIDSLVHGAPVESRSRADRMQEDPGDGTLINPAARPDLASSELTPELLDARSELSRLLTGLAYPANRDQIVQIASEQGAGQELVSRLEALPLGRYSVFEAVWEALGGPPDPPER